VLYEISVLLPVPNHEKVNMQVIFLAGNGTSAAARKHSFIISSLLKGFVGFGNISETTCLAHTAMIVF
jgi:hypothetical protein